MSNIVEAEYRVVHERSLPVIASEILYIESQVAKKDGTPRRDTDRHETQRGKKRKWSTASGQTGAVKI